MTEWCGSEWLYGRWSGRSNYFTLRASVSLLPYLLWSVVAANGDSARNEALWFCLGLAVQGKGLWYIWCRCWTGACWCVDPLSLLEGTVDGGRWRSVALPLLRWVTSRCWLWWVGGCVWWSVLLIWLLKSKVCCEGVAENDLAWLQVAWKVACCRKIFRCGCYRKLSWVLVSVGEARSTLWRRWCALQRRFTGGEDEQCFPLFFFNQNNWILFF